MLVIFIIDALLYIYSCSGKCISIKYTYRIEEIAKQHELKLHIDGARIFNASVVSDFPFFVIKKKWFPLFLKKKKIKTRLELYSVHVYLFLIAIPVI